MFYSIEFSSNNLCKMIKTNLERHVSDKRYVPRYLDSTNNPGSEVRSIEVLSPYNARL